MIPADLEVPTFVRRQMAIGPMAKASPLMPAPPDVAPAAPGTSGYQAVRTTDLAGLAASLVQTDLGPGIPMVPSHPDSAEPRLWDYAPGYNVGTTPRAFEELTFATLRNLARGWDVAALCIARNVDDLRQLKWEIRPKAIPNMAREAVKARRDRLESTRSEVEGFWQTPDQKRSWSSWVRRWALQTYEIDAAALYLSMTLDGSLAAVRVVDGSTLRPLLDSRGDTPAAPWPAYMQVIRGLPWSMYRADAELPANQRRLIFDRAQLIYEPFWQRDDSPYGHPPMETVILTVQRALARQILDLSLFVDGTTSYDFWKTPKEWTDTQLAALQKAYDAMMQIPSERAKLRFMPGGEGTGLEHGFVSPTTEAEEFLLHVGCAAYNRSPMEMGFIRSSGGAGLGGKGVTKEQGASGDKAVKAIALHLKSLVDRVIQRHQSPELELVFPELEDVEDAKTRAEAEDIRMRNGSLGLDEARVDRDLDPIGSAKPGATNLVYLGTNPPVRLLDLIGEDPAPAAAGDENPATPSAVPGISATPTPAAAPAPEPPTFRAEPDDGAIAKADLAAWQRKSLKAVKAGRAAAVPFRSEAIAPELVAGVAAALAIATSPAEVRAVFELVR